MHVFICFQIENYYLGLTFEGYCIIIYFCWA